MRYRIVATEVVLNFALTATAAERRRLAEALRQIATSPVGMDDEEVRVASGRIYKVRLTQGFRVVYGPDHVRKEVEVIDVEPSHTGRRG